MILNSRFHSFIVRILIQKDDKILNKILETKETINEKMFTAWFGSIFTIS